MLVLGVLKLSKMIVYLLMIAYLSNAATIQSEQRSPCPETFYYENRTESDKWFGVVQIQTLEELTGVWITIKLDSRAELMGNWFGESYTSDNKEFRITNSDYVLEAGPPVSVKFFVQYNPANTVPKVETIRLNGKTICSQKVDSSKNVPKLHISKPRPTSSPVGNNEYDTNSGRVHTSSGASDSRDTTLGSLYTENNNKPPVNTNYNYNSRPTSTGSAGSSISKDTNFSGNNESPFSTSYNSVSRPTSTGSVGNSNKNDNYNRGNSNQEFTNNIHDTNTDTYKSNVLSTNGNNRGNTIIRDESNRDENNVDDLFTGDFNLPNDSSIQRYNNSKKQQSQLGVGCGTVVLRPKPLISFAQDTTPGEWPWHVAIYRTKGIQLIYICGGTLLSGTHILTAAHCVTKSRSRTSVDPKALLVYLGKYNLKSFGPETQDRDVENIYVHPQFNSSTFYNDIAIIKLSRPVEMTDYVRPICLWEDETNLEYLNNKEGTVIGWGFDENRSLSEKLMQAKMPIVSTIQCIYSNREFFSRFTFDKNFCAGFRNGTSVCNGDSGGSMVFPKRGTSGQNTVWQIRGLVSVGVALQTEGVCDTSQYVIFTDVAKYLSWIRQIVNSNTD